MAHASNVYKNTYSVYIQTENVYKKNTLQLMWHSLGNLVQQPGGFKAFIPSHFPPKEPFILSPQLDFKHGEAMRLLGKLDGISQLLPDIDFFLLMFVRREAAASSQIEGTQATIIDAIEADLSPKSSKTNDVDDIICYIRSLNYGLKRFESLPMSIRLIKELHRELMDGARASQHPYPGEFRYTQNWIGGTAPSNANFVPPPAHEIASAMGNIESFIHAEDDCLSPLIKAALIHAQFETIHPFTDGNGRTGRILVTLFLWQKKLLEQPLLYLSEFFKKHQSQYYQHLHAYHNEPANVSSWLDFFFEGIIATSNSAIQLASKITQLREQDLEKVHSLGKIAAATTVLVLKNLFRQPIVDVAKIQEWTQVKTRAGAQKIIDRLIDLEILVQQDPKQTYRRNYIYRSYLRLFQD